MACEMRSIHGLRIDRPIMSKPILQVTDLAVHFRTEEGLVRAVNGVSFDLHRGETLGIVGESGSGKSVTSLALMGLIPTPPGIIAGGKALLEGKDLLKLSYEELSKIRGRRIAMIFQDPMTALNPFLTVEEQLTEVTRLHLGHSVEQAKAHAIEMLTQVGIPAAAQRMEDYPHQFSGGMRQRVMIAMALSCKPEILIADEPTTALDVTIQAQILELIKDLKVRHNTAVLLITHALGVVAGNCDRVLVMYAGRVAEQAKVDDLFARAEHPYSRGLITSIPRLDAKPRTILPAIAGQPPNMLHPPAGCGFCPRCDERLPRCETEQPPLELAQHGGQKACYADLTNRPLPGR